MRIFLPYICMLVSVGCGSQKAAQLLDTEVLVIGGGTGGTAAGISSARLGVPTLLIESGPWLGGMISAAGVTCTDGNHHMPSGIWNEFREKIYAVYGGPRAVATGWVSHTQFEPHVSDSIWKSMAAAEKNLQVKYGWTFRETLIEKGTIAGAVFTNAAGVQLKVRAQVTIDATELGDAIASAAIPFSLGMEAGHTTGEDVGVAAGNDIVQDLTWVAILKDYGAAADCTIAKPAGYNPMEFDGVCTEFYHDTTLKAPNVDARKMLDYGKLPNGKYMINWPNAGNDTYLNVVNMTPEARQQALMAAKQTTLRFVYFIQQQLGYKHLGLADDEFPTEDRLALMPYHREGRRMQGLVRLHIKHIADPYRQPDALYRTGIAVGDYPIDHHHKKNAAAPQHLEFYPVPSYNIPLGALIPQQANGIIAAEKAISVTNVVNGTTRLQPVVMLTGQAAGTLAALSVQQKKAPRDIPVRMVQASLLKQKAYLMPYFDVPPNDQHFDAIQQTGATGLLKGKGEPYQWANRTWFYPDSLVIASDFAAALNEISGSRLSMASKPLLISEAIQLTSEVHEHFPGGPMVHQLKVLNTAINTARAQWSGWGLSNFDLNRPVTRRELSVWLYHTLRPFETIGVHHSGKFIR